MYNFLADNPGLSLAALIVLAGLFVIGLKDLLRFSPVRLWAVATVAAQQAFRRRILWITPLLIIGIIAVCQFQKPIDDQDAVRQNTVVCLFASGLLVTLLTIILAATNLPREIDNRVIYTIATKPVTRLEIILGKALGFARVSFWLLLIMGLFSYAYLRFRNYTLLNSLATQLASTASNDPTRPTLEYYRDQGLLHARDLGLPESLSIYSHLPSAPNDRWMPGGNDGKMVVQFALDRRLLPTGPNAGVILQIPVNLQQNPRSPPPTTSPTTAPFAPPLPRINFALFNSDRSSVLTNADIGQPKGIEFLKRDRGSNFQIPIRIQDEDGKVGKPILGLERILPKDPDAVFANIILQVSADDNHYEYSIIPEGLAIFVPGAPAPFLPTSDLMFIGNQGIYGQQLRGGSTAPDRVAVYRFTAQKPHDLASQHCLFEVRLGVERLEEDESTSLILDVYNRSTRQWTRGIQTTVETNRPVYLNVPTPAVNSGDFDVVVRTPNNAWIGLRDGPAASVKLVKHDQSFAFNLAKSLLVIWLFSVLVAITALFASTFLSWPIAFVLTVVILCGRWTTQQFVDSQTAGIGRQVVNDLMPSNVNPASAKAVSQSVDVLVNSLNAVAAVLPDIGQFSAIQDIQQGVAISPAMVLLPALQVTLGFGLPLLVLAYVFLKFKEVAP